MQARKKEKRRKEGKREKKGKKRGEKKRERKRKWVEGIEQHLFGLGSMGSWGGAELGVSWWGEENKETRERGNEDRKKIILVEERKMKE